MQMSACVLAGCMHWTKCQHVLNADEDATDKWHVDCSLGNTHTHVTGGNVRQVKLQGNPIFLWCIYSTNHYYNKCICVFSNPIFDVYIWFGIFLELESETNRAENVSSTGGWNGAECVSGVNLMESKRKKRTWWFQILTNTLKQLFLLQLFGVNVITWSVS